TGSLRKLCANAAGNHLRRSVLLPSSIGQDATLSRWRERFDSARERQLFQVVSRVDVLDVQQMSSKQRRGESCFSPQTHGNGVCLHQSRGRGSWMANVLAQRRPPRSSLCRHSSGIQNGRLRTPPIGSWST